MKQTALDKETQDIQVKNNHLADLVGSDGWKSARKLITDKIISLQTTAEYADIIQTGNATKLLKEMKANIRAAEILFDWLREIEGGAQAAIDEKNAVQKEQYIIRG